MEADFIDLHLFYQLLGICNLVIGLKSKPLIRVDNSK